MSLPFTVPDLTGKVAIVTGANSPAGIGFNVALGLALNGVKTYVGARSIKKSEDAIVQMQSRSSELRNGDLLYPFVADLGDLKQVRKTADDFVKNEKRLDILVNNAMMTQDTPKFHESGVLLDFVVNHLGPFVLTKELMPLLEKTAKQSPGVRVINVSSEAHATVTGPIKLDSISAFNQEMDGGIRQYGLSKLANVLFTKELQRRFEEAKTPAVSVALHPGRIKTDGAKSYLPTINLEHIIPELEEPEIQAVAVPLFAATRPEIWTDKAKYAGAYLVPPAGAVEEPSENARNAKLAEELWEASERVTHDALST